VPRLLEFELQVVEVARGVCVGVGDEAEPFEHAEARVPERQFLETLGRLLADRHRERKCNLGRAPEGAFDGQVTPRPVGERHQFLAAGGQHAVAVDGQVGADFV